MLLSDYVTEVRNEYQTDLTDDEIKYLIQKAVEHYSHYVPRKVLESFSDASGQQTISLSSPLYSSRVVIKTTINNIVYTIDPTEYTVHQLDQEIEFSSPLSVDSIDVYYYTNHTLTDTETSIPKAHERAIVYLTCYFIALKEWYQNDFIRVLDNGIARIQFDTSLAKDKPNDYLSMFFHIIQSKGQAGTPVEMADLMINDASDIWW